MFANAWPSRTLAAAVSISIACSLLASDAIARGRPVSELPMAPRVVPAKEPQQAKDLPGLKVELTGGGITMLSANTDAGYCIVTPDDFAFELATGYSPQIVNEPRELWRFTEDASGAKLERTSFQLSGDDAHVLVHHKQSVTLAVVGRARLRDEDGPSDAGDAGKEVSSEVIVWGFREANGDVTLLSRGAVEGRELPGLRKGEPPTTTHILRSECDFGAARLAVRRAATGTAAHLRGRLGIVDIGAKPLKPQFTIDASLTKLTRDPEPMLATRILVHPGDDGPLTPRVTFR